MEVNKDNAVGVIPVFKRGNEFLFCLIQDAKGVWGFPKGHIDEGEDKQTTARRELQEEAGIDSVEFEGKMFTEHYRYEGNGKEYDKTVVYYLGFVQSTENHTPAEFKHEIPEMKWLPLDEAAATIRPQTKSLLQEVRAYLESVG